MRADYTDITIVLDRSGSMERVRNDTIGGFNSFLHDQRKGEGKVVMTLVQFDDVIEPVYEGRPIESVGELTRDTFSPRGCTALFDAVGRTIKRTGQRLSFIPESERPAKVLFVIITDGEENASREFPHLHAISQMISHQRDRYAWQFVFLGANQDAFKTAGQLGIRPAATMTYAANWAGTASAFDSISKTTHKLRAGGASAGAMANSTSFDTADYAAQAAAGAVGNPTTGNGAPADTSSGGSGH